MTALIFDQLYWEQRYAANRTEWDAGSITTPLKDYFDQLTDKEIRILIPGGGNSYEAEYLHNNGFTNVSVIDLAQKPLDNIRSRVPGFPEKHLIKGNFFEHEEAYDLIVEQTFFCAIHPDEREQYAQKSASLLRPGGKLVGLLFNREFEGGPPFGGTEEEYRTYFNPLFDFRVFELCYNSIKPRTGTELFMILVKKQ